MRPGPLKRRASLKRGKPLRRRTGLKRSAPMKRRRPRPETSAAKAARLAFNDNVAAKPCFFADFTEAGEPRRPDHVCDDGPLDAHHLIEKQWIKRYFGDLPEDELLEILFATIIGCPLCRSAHEPVTRKTARIYFEELDPDLIDFCERIDQRYAGQRRPSILARLEVECPRRDGRG